MSAVSKALKKRRYSLAQPIEIEIEPKEDGATKISIEMKQKEEMENAIKDMATMKDKKGDNENG